VRFRFTPICLLFLAGCGSRTGLPSSYSETADAAPPSDCPDSPDKPLELATLGDFDSYEQVTAMAVAQGYVYYEVGPNTIPTGVYRVPIGGGAPTMVVHGSSGCDVSSPFAAGSLATDGRYLFGQDEVAIGCTAYPVHVDAYDVTDGTLFELPIPPGADSMPRAVAPQALDGGGAAWMIDPGTYTGPVVLARWTGGPTSTLVASLPSWATGFVVVAGVGFVSTIETGTVTLDAVSLANGTVTALGTFGVDFALYGANDEAIFYTPDGSTLSRREAAGGAVTVLSVPLPVRASWVDRDYFYFDSSEVSPPSFPAIVMRIPAKGGPAKQIYRDDARDGVQAITGDACNVYWVAGPDFGTKRPPALFARRR
jgi:hypothetical protein